MTWLTQLHDSGWTIELWNTHDMKWCLRLRYGQQLINAEASTWHDVIAEAYRKHEAKAAAA